VCSAAIEGGLFAPISGLRNEDTPDEAPEAAAACFIAPMNPKENMMRKTLLLGTTAVVLALVSASAYAMGGGNVSPEASPYAILEPQTLAPSTMTEGRAAYTGSDAGGWFGFGAQPSYAAPAAPAMTPEERNYYSRGR
jgi:hypothetical protein